VEPCCKCSCGFRRGPDPQIVELHEHLSSDYGIGKRGFRIVIKGKVPVDLQVNDTRFDSNGGCQVTCCKIGCHNSRSSRF
jgi:hypothetical protein